MSACADISDFDKTPSGLRYKFHKQHPDNPKVELYDVVKVQMNYRTADSVLYIGGNTTIPFQIDPVYEGDLMEGIMMMHLNDSATFLLNTSDFFLKMMNYDVIPPHARDSKELYFDIKVVEVRPETEALKKRRLELEERKNTEMQKIASYLLKNNITAEPAFDGLYIIETQEGSGPVAAINSEVKVHYTGKLLDGTVFDSSHKRGVPVSFTLGKGEVIPAWDKGIAGMKQGAKALLIASSALAYGDKERNNVKPYTPLIFDIEIIEVK